GETADDWIVAERTSLACMLLPASGDELRRAVALADLAVAAGGKSSTTDNPYLQFVEGLAEYRQGRHQQAIPLRYESARQLPNRAGPTLVLAMAQFRSGSPQEARKTLAAAIRTFNWSESPADYQADQAKVWASHVLRREAEALILPNLPAFLRGDYQPQDNDERLALLGTCQFQDLPAAAPRLSPHAPPLRRPLRCQSEARRRIDRALCPPDTRERGSRRPDRGLQLRVPLLRRPVRGPGRVRTREGRGEAQRRGAGALAQPGTRVAPG